MTTANRLALVALGTDQFCAHTCTRPVLSPCIYNVHRLNRNESSSSADLGVRQCISVYCEIATNVVTARVQ